MPARPDFLTNSMIIGAHPDDEMLWFNAIVGKVDKVVSNYPPPCQRRGSLNRWRHGTR